MTGWDFLLLGGLFLAIFVTEFFVLYASTALGNVDIDLSKWLLASFLATIIWAALSLGGHLLLKARADAAFSLFSAENRTLLLSVSASALLLSWLVMSFAFVPVFPVTISRGMLVSIFQLLLRVFLYILIAAVVMVILAILQIRYQSPEKPAASAAAVVRTA